nr:truncated gag protein [Simian immunodeficiency virus]
MGARNSVLSGK